MKKPDDIPLQKRMLATIEAMQAENILLRERVTAAQRYSQQLESELTAMVNIAINDGTAAAVLKDQRLQITELRASLRKMTQEKAKVYLAAAQSAANAREYIEALSTKATGGTRTLQ